MRLLLISQDRVLLVFVLRSTCLRNYHNGFGLVQIGHSSSNCRKIVGANDSKGKEVAAISSLAKKGVRPQEETGLVAYKSATYDKQQWVPKPSTTESTVAVANSKTQTSKTVVEKIIQSNYHPVRLPQSHDAAGASQEPDTLEALEVRNASAKKV
ncbi:hypothetical protein M9H77_17118 [Catharanthus roseus]|uniref:Uncharacterized protein n=1 Tax=Catharanthus roseus TaxID=4058 RepID=A0ACC0B3N2_CATRO|nr:hypothetical protein M9H77_17118 [Catharanthus roseus]